MTVFRDVLRRRGGKGVGKMLSWPPAGVNTVGGPAWGGLQGHPRDAGVPSFLESVEFKVVYCLKNR